MLKAVFYARFHPERGPSVIHQYPETAINVSTTEKKSSLLDFSNISSYVIPVYELCNKPLAICTNGYRVLGFPVSLEDEKYERNRFTYNVCFILDESADPKPWERIVSKTAAFFTDLEATEGLLQTEERLGGLKWAGDECYPADVGVLYSLLETVFFELNTYGETCVMVTDLHVLNLRLASPAPPHRDVRHWDVPLLIRALPNGDDWTYDLALRQINPHINGVNHVQKVSELADVDIDLIIKTIRGLLSHGRIMLLDIFHFHAIYALTADFASFVKDDALQEECLHYVAKSSSEQFPSGYELITLYRSLNPGVPVKDFYLAHESRLVNIDVRRFITFGVIKGFVRRIHKYALSVESQAISVGGSRTSGSPSKAVHGLDVDADDRNRAWRKAAFSSGWATPPLDPSAGERDSGNAHDGNTPAVEGGTATQNSAELLKYLDGQHCMDEICVALHMSEKQVMERLRGTEVLYFNR
ncbi:Nitrogen permease regulator 2 [Saxophila tyrrhenica]|uniref:Nitrogen permease regulator 2 n=1 Tax=Saxophila tyrrhenica TaxID=1690608 RepID=A0AAV9PCI5_9PEZI|nr:Nitrogen permease regulator 2 [Saxophila tyrrhenica]